MIFSNTSINIEELPKVEEVEFHRLAPAWLTVSYIGTALFFSILLIPVLVLVLTRAWEHPVLYILPVVWLLWLLLSVWLTRKEFRIRGYSLREKDIIYRKGVLFRSITAVPFNRVQHVEIKQDPISRFFGLHKLEVYTAGGESSDLSIPGLAGDIAQQLKTFIIHQTTATDEQADL